MTDLDTRRKQVREAQRRFRASAKGKEADRRYKKSAAGKAARIRYTKAWRMRNKTKSAAHQIVKYAIETDKLKKGKCEVCNSPKVVAHHDDYTKPLSVRWLCQKHHIEIHCEPAYRKTRASHVIE